jgi:hypothetical protein
MARPSLRVITGGNAGGPLSSIDGTGNGGDNGSMPPELEPRVAVLEQIAKDTKESMGNLRADFVLVRGDVGKLRDNQERDFRLLFGAIIVATLGLAGLMAKGFNWL